MFKSSTFIFTSVVITVLGILSLGCLLIVFADKPPVGKSIVTKEETSTSPYWKLINAVSTSFNSVNEPSSESRQSVKSRISPISQNSNQEELSSSTSVLSVNPKASVVTSTKPLYVFKRDYKPSYPEIIGQPVAIWLTGYAGESTVLQSTLKESKTQAHLPVFVLYNIPGRDCGLYSAGGASSASAYKKWIDEKAALFTGFDAWVVLEPDALAGYDCLSNSKQAERIELLTYAAKKLEQIGVKVFVDAGHAKWQLIDTMANRLKSVGLVNFTGFALNVSNFITTSESTTYGTALSQKTGAKQFIIDTSRNGKGPASNFAWCNPEGRALGVSPTIATGNTLIAGLLWIKIPGESDGNCNGAPAAGVWWPEYAQSLINNR